MTFASARRARAKKRLLTCVALLVAVGALAVLTPTTAQAGQAGRNGRLAAMIYNDSPVPMEYVRSWSQFGFTTTPSSVAVEHAAAFELNGSPVVATTNEPVPCWWYNLYNGWFTYKVSVPHTTVVEYITFSIHGARKVGSGGLGCTFDTQPALDVHQTSTPPPETWRPDQGAPPNVLADPKFAYQHNVPSLFDQTITWDGEGPGDGVPTVVSIGDSTISGEGGRWAGNTNHLSSSRIDAGSTWYADSPTGGETEPGCHRAKSALVHIGGRYRSKNFACSGAETVSYDWDYAGRGWRYKPGIDSMCSATAAEQLVGAGATCRGSKPGQLGMLEIYAKTHNVRHVVLAIGANDFDFSEVVSACAKIYQGQHLAMGDYRCYRSGIPQAAVTTAKRDEMRHRIYHALLRVKSTMTAAGYAPQQYDIIVQNYWSAIPSDADIRIADVGFDREQLGGCPIMDPDATMLNEYLLTSINSTVLEAARLARNVSGIGRIRFMDVSEALKGHRLCEKGALLIEDVPGGAGKVGTDPFFADKVEWVAEMRSAEVLGSEYTLAEGGHANYWGQLAQRNCLRQLIVSNWNGGKCTPAATGGATAEGEPKMTLTPRDQWWW